MWIHNTRTQIQKVILYSKTNFNVHNKDFYYTKINLSNNDVTILNALFLVISFLIYINGLLITKTSVCKYYTRKINPIRIGGLMTGWCKDAMALGGHGTSY